MAIIALTLASAALCASGTALFRAQKFPASAQTSIRAELVAPTSYEQYLTLTSPQSVAASDGYLAIADGNTLFVYDKADGLYREYLHDESVQKVEFDKDGNLYFLSHLRLYKLTPEGIKQGEKALSLDIACIGFAIENDVLCYYASNTVLTFTSLSDPTSLKTVSLERPLQTESPLAFGKDGLYCVLKNEGNGHTVYAINLQTYGLTAITNLGGSILSMTVANNLLCFVTESQAFFSYNVTDLSAGGNASEIAPITKDEGGYLSVCAHSGSVYAVRDNIVRHYSVENAAFTEYEISASSASPYRLNGATELTLNKNRLFIADEGNDRISVYDTETKEFEAPIQTEFSTPYLASYQNTLLVASESETIVYSLTKRTYGQPLLHLQDEDVEGKIVGVASVYGRYYVLTEENYCYTLSKESGEWSYSKMQKNTQTLRAVAFTADVYGSLYIAYDDDTVYRFTEKELLNANERGVKILENLQFPEKIAVDYETDLYALVNGTVHEYTQSAGGTYVLNTSYTPDYGLVKDETPHARSFAFGFENEFTYLLYEGDYIVRTDEFSIPAVNPIPVGDAAEIVFGEESADFTVVTVAVDSILIEFDAALLQEATEFPYVAFERTQTQQTALKLGEEGEYSLLAIAKQRTGDYETCLVLSESCTELERSAYRTDYEKAQDGYLTNAVSLYKFPYLNELFAKASPARGTQVELLGEVIELDHAYYQVRFTDENGAVKTGFIPKRYVNLFDGSTPVPETVISGSTQSDEDGVWRSTYLILGFGAIVILVDFLILHRSKEWEE